MFKTITYTTIMFLSLSAFLLATISVTKVSGSRETKQAEGPSISGATAWLNTAPLTLADLRGKVVLIDFWTFTCINWRRTLPYLREWATRYKDKGLIVIGVHTPEFLFEHGLENVRRSLNEMDISYPVAMDNNFGIWRSFQNQYWPALYLIDAKGKLRYQKFGEGDYIEPELQIQKLLRETSAKNIPSGPAIFHGDSFELAADWVSLLSPENFLGYERTQGFASPQGIIAEKVAMYSLPQKIKLNQWALSGEWTMRKEYIGSKSLHGKITYRFHARDLHVIMGSANLGASVKFRVLIDGEPPGNAHGLEVDSNGYGIVTDSRMYQLIRQQGTISEHEFQIEFLEPGIEVYDFTFG